MRFLDQFLEMMAKERGARRSTLSAYETDLRNFYEFLKNQSLEKATLTDIQDYLATQSHLSLATMARRLSSLRQFYAYLVNKGATTENPLPLIKLSPVKPFSPSPLNQAHLERLWEGVTSWQGPKGKRLSVLLHLLQSADMPVKEIVSLPYTIALFETLPLLTAPPKSSSRVPTGDAAIQEPQKLDCDVAYAPRNDEVKLALQDYLNVRPYFLTQGQDSPWLFPSSSQQGHLTPQRFGQLLKELGLKVGIDPALISFSTFRCGLLPAKN